MKKTKTLNQETAESLNRRAGQYERHGRRGVASILRDAAKRLLGIQVQQDKTWEKNDE